MAYNYGPPPPAPPPAPSASGGYPQYPPYQSQGGRGGHSGRGGRGNHHPQAGGRPNYQAPSPYGYNPQPAPQHQPPPYGPQHPGQHPTQYPAQHQQPGPGGYPQAPQQPPQQWPDQGHQHHAPGPQALPPQNYHPNYAQHLYHQQQQQQQAYGHQQPPPPPPPQQQQQQQTYGAPPLQPYGQPYAAPQPPSGPPQQWGAPAPAPSHSPPTQPHQQQYGSGRGRGAHHNSSKAQPMGPPIRMGFDNAPLRDPNAPVSSGYPPQPYGPPQGSSPYPPAPYQGYPPPAAAAAAAVHPVTGPPHQHGAAFQQNGRHHGRGGFNNHGSNFRQRLGFNDNKGRHQHHNRHNNNNNTNHNANHNKKSGAPPSAPQTHHQKPDAASAGKKKKRKTNTLGLTPGDDTEDDLDEEIKLSELLGGEVPKLSDIAAWIEERKRKFPTQNRVKAKLATSGTSKNGGAKDERTLALEKEQAKADKLRRELERVESSLKRKREQQDAGDDMRGVAASTSKSPSLKSEDDRPEVASVKQDPNANLPPPPKKADPTKHCKYYSTGGTCGKKGKCRFVHDPAVREAALKEREMNGGRMTLQQRLTLNDKDQEDLTIIKTLAYLKDKGLMEAKSASNGTGANDKTPTPSTKSSLPPPPANGLPPQPPPSVISTPAVRYQGWNLSGFGNTGVKSDH
ncbi:hypothetical protein DHEL01_v204696 [Diaporthe helianthi]|uniref:C3H1-type domain-containing protein n=1 Tax=Diaporthe helianthi TaxID=158607 RepID=A0A2P5I372_DIAHE|nr:hypothetical protein DHEL01_v204696 [Diaporthe helianthi]